MSLVIRTINIEIAGNAENVDALLSDLKASLSKVEGIVATVNGEGNAPKRRGGRKAKAGAKRGRKPKAESVKAEKPAKKVAKVKAEKGSGMSKAGKEAIAAAAKKRWAAFRKAKKAVAKATEKVKAPKASKVSKPVTKKAVKVGK